MAAPGNQEKQLLASKSQGNEKPRIVSPMPVAPQPVGNQALLGGRTTGSSQAVTLFGPSGEVVVGPASSEKLPLVVLGPAGEILWCPKRNEFPDFMPVSPAFRVAAIEEAAKLSQQLGIPIRADRMLEAPWVGRIYDQKGEWTSQSSSAGWERNNSRFWSEYQRQFPNDFKLLNEDGTISVEFAKKMGWPTEGPNSVVGDNMEHHHVGNGTLVAPVPTKLHKKESGKIHGKVGIMHETDPSSLIIASKTPAAKKASAKAAKKRAAAPKQKDQKPVAVPKPAANRASAPAAKKREAPPKQVTPKPVAKNAAASVAKKGATAPKQEAPKPVAKTAIPPIVRKKQAQLSLSEFDLVPGPAPTKPRLAKEPITARPPSGNASNAAVRDKPTPQVPQQTVDEKPSGEQKAAVQSTQLRTIPGPPVEPGGVQPMPRPTMPDVATAQKAATPKIPKSSGLGQRLIIPKNGGGVQRWGKPPAHVSPAKKVAGALGQSGWIAAGEVLGEVLENINEWGIRNRTENEITKLMPQIRAFQQTHPRDGVLIAVQIETWDPLWRPREARAVRSFVSVIPQYGGEVKQEAIDNWNSAQKILQGSSPGATMNTDFVWIPPGQNGSLSTSRFINGRYVSNSDSSRMLVFRFEDNGAFHCEAVHPLTRQPYKVEIIKSWTLSLDDPAIRMVARFTDFATQVGVESEFSVIDSDWIQESWKTSNGQTGDAMWHKLD